MSCGASDLLNDLVRGIYTYSIVYPIIHLCYTHEMHDVQVIFMYIYIYTYMRMHACIHVHRYTCGMGLYISNDLFIRSHHIALSTGKMVDL